MEFHTDTDAARVPENKVPPIHMGLEWRDISIGTKSQYPEGNQKNDCPPQRHDDTYLERSQILKSMFHNVNAVKNFSRSVSSIWVTSAIKL